MANNGIRWHDDGTVEYWSVYRQGWERMPPAYVADADLATLPRDEREAIIAQAAADRR